jgi:hypothetical protein
MGNTGPVTESAVFTKDDRAAGERDDQRVSLLPDFSDPAWRETARTKPLSTLSTPKGDLDFSYDNSGKLFSISREDGWAFTKANDGNWFETKPGGDTEYARCRVIQDDKARTITLKYADRAIIFSGEGVREERIAQPSRIESPELIESRRHLIALGERDLDDGGANLKAQMKAFEKRAREQGLSDKEIQQTYGYVGRLLDSTSTRYTSVAQRRELAEQILEQAAEPRHISQGNHNTCNVTSVESVVYTRCPSRAAKLVSDIALTGQSPFVGPDGTMQNVKVDNCAPVGEAKDNFPREDGKRSYASQLFQVAAINMHWQLATEYNGSAGTFKYEQLDVNDNTDTGERLWDTSETPPKELRKTPYLFMNDIVDICNGITGKSDSIYLAYDDGDAKTTSSSRFKTEEELKDLLVKAKKEGKLPAIIMVATDESIFWNDQNGPKYESTDNPWHVVTVRDFDANGHRVAFANQWEQAQNHLGKNAVDLRDLFMATRATDYVDPNDATVGTIPELEKRVDWLKAHSRRELHTELELLRLKHNHEQIDDAAFEDQLVALAKDTNREWKDAVGGYEIKRRDRVLRQFDLILRHEDAALLDKVKKELEPPAQP